MPVRVHGFLHCEGVGYSKLARSQQMLSDLHERLENIEYFSIDPSSPEFVDFLADAVSKAKTSRTDAKVRRFSAIVANQCVAGHPWEDAFMSNRLLSGLEDLHIEIMELAVNLPCKQVSDNNFSTVLAFDTRGFENVYELKNLLPNYSKESLIIACMELNNTGLLFDTGSMLAGHFINDWYAKTNLTTWLLERLSGYDSHI